MAETTSSSPSLKFRAYERFRNCCVVDEPRTARRVKVR